jgi:lipoprotein-anchoring transpeptidase ErfK/SrfK
MIRRILPIPVLLAAIVQVFGQGPGHGDSRRVEKIVISKETFTLTAYGASDVKIAEYPIAVGANYGNKKKVGDKKTPEGAFRVQQIQNASLWTHDFGDGKGEIKGAYGSHFIRLLTPGHKGIGIHGTHDPGSIGTRATEGCIRLRNEDLQELVKMVYVDLPVVITGSERDLAADGVHVPPPLYVLRDTLHRHRSAGR